MSHVVNIDELPHTNNAHEFVGANFDAPVSLILVHSASGEGPALHRHPYPEVFVVEAGTATFVVDDVEVTTHGRHVVVAPSNSWHGFKNTGAGELRLTAIHTAPTFDTEWRAASDPAWVSPPGT